MSLILEQDTNPKSLYVKAYAPKMIIIGDYEIGEKDFFAVIRYYMENTNLEENDIRFKIIEYMKTLKEVDGYSFMDNSGEKRLSIENK